MSAKHDMIGQPQSPRLNLVMGILRMRCPKCRVGRIFCGSISMNDPCPHCGMLFQREEGYFLGAMYVSTVLSIAVYCTWHVAWSIVFGDWLSYRAMFCASLSVVPFLPAIFRYSRVLWIYMERDCCPSEHSAGPYEKMRLRQISAQDLPDTQS